MTDRAVSGSAPAVTRAAAILNLLAESGSAMTLSDISRSLQLAKSSTYNLCNALEEAGLIIRRDSLYRLGRRLVELGGAYLRSSDLVQEFYQQCADSTVLRHELLQLAVLDNTDVLYVARHEGRAPLRLSATIGDRFPASITAVGNVLLAQLTEAEIAERYRDPKQLAQWTGKSVASLAALQAKLRLVRKRGYAIDEGETNTAVVGLAVLVSPRTSAEDHFALGASLLLGDDMAERRARVLSELQRVAATLSNPMLAGKPVEAVNQESS